MSLIDDEEQANRLARAIADDLALYNEPALAAPVRDRRDLLVRLSGPIAEGRELFDSRVDSTKVSASVFDAALSEVLLARANVDATAPAEPGDFSSIQRSSVRAPNALVRSTPSRFSPLIVGLVIVAVGALITIVLASR